MLRPLKVSAVLLIMCLLTGCGTHGLVIDGSCQVFKPISNSTKDTVQTRREVIAHNKVFKNICG